MKRSHITAPSEFLAGKAIGDRKPPTLARILALSTALVISIAACVQAAHISKIYYLGDCLPSSSPSDYIGDDPALDVIAVPATVFPGWFTNDEVARALRVYMPRTYTQLLEGRLLLLSDVSADTIPSRYLEWFTRAVQDEGMSLMMIGGVLSFGGAMGFPSWAITTIGPLLPVECIPDMLSAAWKPIVVSADDPLMTALPWGSCPDFYGYNVVRKKEGAKLLAETNDKARNPFMVVWNVGRGRSFAFCTDWTPSWGASFMEWDYYPDFTVYSIYYALGRDVPQDLALMHRLRSSLLAYRVQRDILISLLNFVEKVGGKIRGVEEDMREPDLLRLRATESYIVQDYEGCVRMLEEAMGRLKGVESEALKVKAKAMLSIWMVEWVVVTSTFMVAGFVLWTLMLQRRLYRKVVTTRGNLRGDADKPPVR